jgi:hypothetical protein
MAGQPQAASRTLVAHFADQEATTRPSFPPPGPTLLAAPWLAIHALPVGLFSGL